jgi:hypothetical protein
MGWNLYMSVRVLQNITLHTFLKQVCFLQTFKFTLQIQRCIILCYLLRYNFTIIIYGVVTISEILVSIKRTLNLLGTCYGYIKSLVMTHYNIS